MHKINPEMKYIIRTNRAGVFFGNVADFDAANRIATLENARRLWYWDGACSLSELAELGTTAPNNCKFSITVKNIIVCEVIEIIPCSEKAAKQIEGVSEWKRH